MDSKFLQDFEGLIEKYAELLIGETSEEMIQKIKIFALYSHISKSMPPLANHWNHAHPDAKNEIRKIFDEIKELNTALREQKK